MGPPGPGSSPSMPRRNPNGSMDRRRFTLEAQGEGTIRRLTGELVVAVPLIRTRAERSIVNGLRRRLDIEAEQLERRLRG